MGEIQSFLGRFRRKSLPDGSDLGGAGCDRGVVKTFVLGESVSIRTMNGHLYPPVLSEEGWEATRLLGAGRILSHQTWSQTTCRGVLGAAR